MRVMVAALLICLTLGMVGQTAWASPMDLSGFTVFPDLGAGVSVSGNTVTFEEQYQNTAIYFCNSAYTVGDKVVLSFDYSSSPGPSDVYDYLVLEVFELGDYNQVLYEPIGSSGHFSIDLTPYLDPSGQVDIAWGLLSNEDEAAGSLARVYNIDVSQVPIPSTAVLLASGCAGLAWLRGRKFRR